MDLYQQKLSKLEWESIEIPVTQQEKKIIEFIKNSYSNVNNKFNDNNSILNDVKIINNEQNHYFLFDKYFKKKVSSLDETFNLGFSLKKKKKDKPKKIDIMKLENYDKSKKDINVFENNLLTVCEDFLQKYFSKSSDYVISYYTLIKMTKLAIKDVNSFVDSFITFVLDKFYDQINFNHIVKNAQIIIEKNTYLNKLADTVLYNHQKEIFTTFKKSEQTDSNCFIIDKPKLVLYIAPTATGKTLTPIGLSEKYRVIFVCAARHVGLALAKSALSVGKKIALAFNCQDPTDIRLNYAAGSKWFRHEFDSYGNCSCSKPKCKKEGQYITLRDGSRKIDHSDGSSVEIIICDIKSYLPAMHYMNSFNQVENIITFWDEPTISLDEDSHPLHEIIKNNWNKNIIPNIVLSSATLPKEHEINSTLNDYRGKFGGDVISIVSHDCKKSIPILDKDNKICLPHLLWENYNDLLNSVTHCENYKTILRYFDLHHICEFIIYVNEKKYVEERYFIERYFENIIDIDMYSLKNYYLLLLKNTNQECWNKIYKHFQNKDTSLYDSTSYFITSDAYTLSDGPTIFLADDITKIAKFCMQQAKIPTQILKEINESIEFNNTLHFEIDKLDKQFDDSIKGYDEDSKKMTKDDRLPPEAMRLKRKIDELRNSVKLIELHDLFIPNRKEHLEKWANNKKFNGKPFSCDISEATIIEIMKLKNVDDIWKILLLMGIGVFVEHENGDYTQIMKDLAMNQKLYMIIASSNYIYGTNYQFCHGYIGKDLTNMTQEKTIQALGRIGRTSYQQIYSIRFRENSLIKNLFVDEKDKKEVINMNKLFCSDED